MLEGRQMMGAGCWKLVFNDFFRAADKREKAVSVRDADSEKSGEYLAFNKL